MQNSMDHIDLFSTKMSPFVKKHSCLTALLESPLSKSCATLNKEGLTFLLCLDFGLSNNVASAGSAPQNFKFSEVFSLLLHDLSEFPSYIKHAYRL